MEKHTIRVIVDNEKCTGCFLCYNICPSKAIIMENDKDGFFAPIIDDKKCNICGKCFDLCPMNSFINTNKTIPKIYSGWSNNDYYLNNSSSGGIFPELANFFIKNFKGIVYGAAWNKFPILKHIKIENSDSIGMLMSSKYLQSEIGKVFSEINEYCKKGKYILFSGTPCQVAGIKKIVDSDKLFTIDLVCHGIPSRKVFLKYIKENMITNINFRDKRNGWENFSISYGNKIKYKPHRLDPFFYGYLENLYLQEICYACPFSKLPRVADITLGDYWGIEKKYKNKNGTSLIVLNNYKGTILLEKLVKEKRIIVRKSSLSDASNMNPRLVRGNIKVPIERKEILNKIDSHKFCELSNKYFFNNKIIIYETLRRIYKKLRNII